MVPYKYKHACMYMHKLYSMQDKAGHPNLVDLNQ